MKSLNLVCLAMFILRFVTPSEHSSKLVLDANCPRNWIDVPSVTCVCSVVNAGVPSVVGGGAGGVKVKGRAIAMWYDQGGRQLSVGTLIVKSSDISPKNRFFKCKAKGGDGDVIDTIKEVIYTPKFVEKPMVTMFTANDKTLSVAMKVNDTVTFECHATGVPTPKLLVKGYRSRREVISSVNDRKDKEEEGKEEATHGGVVRRNGRKVEMSVDAIMLCGHTDLYQCLADNGFGLDVRSITVLVRCIPEFSDHFNLTANQYDLPWSGGMFLTIRIAVIAYPIPLGFKLLKEEGDTLVDVSQRRYNVTSQATQPPNANVTLTMHDLTLDDVGRYVFVMANGVGKGLDYSFIVSGSQDETLTSAIKEERPEIAMYWIGLVGFAFVYLLCFMVWAKADAMTSPSASTEAADHKPLS